MPSGSTRRRAIRWRSVDGNDQACRSCNLSHRIEEPPSTEPPATTTSTRARPPVTPQDCSEQTHTSPGRVCPCSPRNAPEPTHSAVVRWIDEEGSQVQSRANCPAGTHYCAPIQQKQHKANRFQNGTFTKERDHLRLSTAHWRLLRKKHTTENPSLQVNRHRIVSPSPGRSGDAAPLHPSPGGLHRLPPRPPGRSLHPKVRTGPLPGRPGLLRAGERHGRRHLLQAVRGQNLLQHRHGHPQTFRGAHHAAPLRRGLLRAAGVVLPVQAAHPAAQRAPGRHRVAGAAGGELRPGQLGAPGSGGPAAFIRGVQTTADI